MPPRSTNVKTLERTPRPPGPAASLYRPGGPHAQDGIDLPCGNSRSREYRPPARGGGPSGRHSFHGDRVIPTAAGRLLEDEEQRDHGERRDHQQLEIIDICNDLGLRRDHGIEGGASAIRGRIPELRDGRGFEHAGTRLNGLDRAFAPTVCGGRFARSMLLSRLAETLPAIN